jgi:diguanylate cyclase (GGDEF)-like protein
MASLGSNLGITARLSLSFAAVAVLAAAANLIAERGTSVVHVTHIRIAPPAPAAPVASAAPAAEVRPRAEALTFGSQADQRAREHASVLILALDRFERAVRKRAESNSPADEDRYRDELERLGDALGQFKRGIDPDSKAAAAALIANVTRHQALAEECIRTADARRDAVGEYSAHLDAMALRIKRSFDGAWKIFGRVIARQSLLQLRANVDEIRGRFAPIVANSADPGALSSLIDSESAFAATFARHRDAYTRSEGAPWAGLMGADFDAIVALRESISNLDAHQSEIANAFTDDGDQLVQAVSRFHPVARARPVPVIRAAVRPAPLVSPVAAVKAPPAPQPLTTTTLSNDDTQRAPVAWITAAVLSILLAVTILTVRSIVVPVRRMLLATTRLARGELDARVPRGGIRELDVLAVAFNRMSDQISAAQELARGYQQALEAKVEERTRQLQHLADHDPLTVLPNRRQLFARLNAALAAAADAQAFVGVLFIDVDNFKNINDSMGHAFGDRVLFGMAQRLELAAREFGFVARLGGDEFTVVYENAPTAAAIEQLGQTLVAAFHEPLIIDGRDLIVSVSTGASVYPDHERSAESLLSAADAALFRAKALGRSQLAMFTPDLLEIAEAKFATEQGLRRAIDRNEFELQYQPEVQLESMEVVVVEALIRWRQADGRIAFPGEFLGVAEESGLIIEISDWVLRTSIAAAAGWYHGAWPEVRVAVNVSPRQLLDSRFVGQVIGLLQEYRLPARCIEIELTETVLQTGAATIDALRALRAHGITVALDDFGTGYSSLTSLEHLPLTRIKIDRSLISCVDSSPRSAAITNAVIALCKSLNLEVTAEGVERPEQLDGLLDAPRMHLQGFWISPPVDESDVLDAKARIERDLRQLGMSRPTPWADNASGARPRESAKIVQLGKSRSG